MRTLRIYEVDEYLKKYEGALFVELCKGSHPYQYLKLNTPTGIENLGRVSKWVFKNYDMQHMDSQPNSINVSWFKFQS